MMAPLEPVKLLEVAKIYQLMPDGFWALLSVIVAFYFGGRMQLKRQDMTVQGGALLVAREILDRRRAEQAAVAQAKPPAATPAGGRGTNRVVEEWRRRQALNPPS